jgi:transposase
MLQIGDTSHRPQPRHRSDRGRYQSRIAETQLRQPVLVETAMGKNAHALLAALDTACANVDELGQASAELFERHPDYAIITSFPGLADSTGARVLAEIGDDRSRFADARALKAYAGSAAVTRHPCLWPIPVGYPSPHQEQPTGQRRLDVGLFGCHQL